VVTSVLQDQQYMFGVRSLLVDEKVLMLMKYTVLPSRSGSRTLGTKYISIRLD